MAAITKACVLHLESTHAYISFHPFGSHFCNQVYCMAVDNIIQIICITYGLGQWLSSMLDLESQARNNTPASDFIVNTSELGCQRRKLSQLKPQSTIYKAARSTFFQDSRDTYSSKVHCECTHGDSAAPSELQYAVHKRIEEARPTVIDSDHYFRSRSSEACVVLPSWFDCRLRGDSALRSRSLYDL